MIIVLDKNNKMITVSNKIDFFKSLIRSKKAVLISKNPIKIKLLFDMDI